MTKKNEYIDVIIDHTKYTYNKNSRYDHITILSGCEIKRCGKIFTLLNRLGTFPTHSFQTEVLGAPFLLFNGLRRRQGREDSHSSSRRPHTSFTFHCRFLTEHKSEPEAVQECHIQVKMEAVPCFILSAVNGASLCCGLGACVLSEVSLCKRKIKTHG